MFQTDSVALKTTRFMNCEKIRTGVAQYISGVTYQMPLTPEQQELQLAAMEKVAAAIEARNAPPRQLPPEDQAIRALEEMSRKADKMDAKVLFKNFLIPVLIAVVSGMHYLIAVMRVATVVLQPRRCSFGARSRNQQDTGCRATRSTLQVSPTSLG